MGELKIDYSTDKVLFADSTLIGAGTSISPIGVNVGIANTFDLHKLRYGNYSGKQYSVLAQQTSSSDLFFKPDGLKLYVVGYGTTDGIHQYELSSAWDISTAIYSGKVLGSGTETIPNSLFINSTGLKLYIVGQTLDTIIEYNLGIAWDISTATLSGATYATGLTFTHGLTFKPDGTKMYVADIGNDLIYQYSLSTPWDLSTITSDSKTLARTNPVGICFKSDGTLIYITSLSAPSIVSYTCSTPWDISTATINTLDILNIPEEATPLGIFICPQGSCAYAVGSTQNTIFQYNLAQDFSIIQSIDGASNLLNILVKGNNNKITRWTASISLTAV